MREDMSSGLDIIWVIMGEFIMDCIISGFDCSCCCIEFMSGMPPLKGFAMGLVAVLGGGLLEEGAGAGGGTEEPAATAAALGTAREAVPRTMWMVWLSSKP